MKPYNKCLNYFNSKEVNLTKIVKEIYKNKYKEL